MVQPRAVTDEDLPEPPQVKRLRRLVSLLMVVLMGGMLVIVAAMVLKLGSIGSPPAFAPVTAGEIALPAGAEIVAIGQGGGGVMMITRDATGAETLRAFDPDSGAQLSATLIIRE